MILIYNKLKRGVRYRLCNPSPPTNRRGLRRKRPRSCARGVCCQSGLCMLRSWPCSRSGHEERRCTSILFPRLLLLSGLPKKFLLRPQRRPLFFSKWFFCTLSYLDWIKVYKLNTSFFNGSCFCADSQGRVAPAPAAAANFKIVLLYAFIFELG